MKKVGLVRFIGHAGISIRSDDFELLIDPWLWSSTSEIPFVRGFSPPNSTIAFMSPESRYRHEDFNPQVILLSNYQSCHAPFREIADWISNQTVCVGLPEPDLQQGRLILAALTPDVFKRVDFRLCLDGTQFRRGPFEITAHFHPYHQHLIWEVRTTDFSVLYVPQTPYNRAKDQSLMDICYEKFANMRPDFLFLECTGQATRAKRGDKSIIQESVTANPVQAARLSAHIHPRFVGIIGQSHCGLGNNQTDYFLPPYFVEEQFKWALNHICPQIKTLSMQSGQEFLITKNAETEKTEICLCID